MQKAVIKSGNDTAELISIVRSNMLFRSVSIYIPASDVDTRIASLSVSAHKVFSGVVPLCALHTLRMIIAL